MIYPDLQQNLYYVQTTTEQTGHAATDAIPERRSDPDRRAFRRKVPSAIQDIGALLRQRHRLRNSDPDDFYIRDMTEITKTMGSTSEMMTKLLLCVSRLPSPVPRVVSHAKNTATATPRTIKTASWRPAILPSVNHRRSTVYRAP